MIIPAVIPTTIHDVERKVDLVKDYVDRVQIDVADGYFAPVETWPIINTNGFVDMVNGDRRLPHHDQVNYEVHLMVQDPMDKIQQWIAAGARAVIPHASMLESPHLIKKLTDSAGVEFGIAVTPTEYQLVDDNLFQLADFVQVMGSDQLGQHGVQLTDESIEVIKRIAKNYKKPIAVDIGVNQNTIGRLRAAGATRFVSGSAIFGSREPEGAIKQLGT